MSVGVSSGVGAVDTYASYNSASVNSAKETQEAKKTETKADSTASAGSQVATDGVVYEKSDKNTDSAKAPYSINKMSKEERAALVEQLKAEEASRKEQLVNLVQKMMGEQATSYANATDMWKFLAKGDFTVDAQTKLQAQQDISEDGYYGITQTSERLFDFASALAGDDVEKMKEMQEAMEEGFKLATKSWGRDLPEISQKTLEAANKKFEEYYASKQTSDAQTENAQTNATQANAAQANVAQANAAKTSEVVLQ